MPRRSWVQINGRLYEKGVDQIPDDPRSKSAAVYGDLPDFISPIDGKVVSGRAGMRDHCARHNVVPTADLKGLPIGPPRVEPNRADIRQELIKQLYK